MIENRTHHILGNDGQDIVVFGTQSAIQMLATTTLIQGNGTFTCVVPPFTQLCIFHGLVKNEVSLPLLYCLVKGKDKTIYTRLLMLIERIAQERGVTILHRPVRVMVDFELVFIKAVRLYEAGRNFHCCFFHFVANIKKRSRPIVDAVKKAAGQSSHEAGLAEKTKRAFMMLPLLPVDFITVEVVDLIVLRWKSFFGDRGGEPVDSLKTIFDELRNHLVREYVGPQAPFQRSSWCVCGRTIRTNNAAESSHAALNASVKVSGVISLDMFLFSIEGQMMNTRREIQRGCPSHTKPIYTRRNHLLAKELSDLLNGRQGIFQYLDHCSTVMKTKNNKGVDKFLETKRTERPSPFERNRIEQNHLLLVRSAINLHNTLWPSVQRPVQDILSTVELWAFQKESCDVDTDVIDEDTILSLARQEPRNSFIEIRNGIMGHDVSSVGTVLGDDVARTITPERQMMGKVFMGQSYKLVIMK